MFLKTLDFTPHATGGLLIKSTLRINSLWRRMLLQEAQLVKHLAKNFGPGRVCQWLLLALCFLRCVLFARERTSILPREANATRTTWRKQKPCQQVSKTHTDTNIYTRVILEEKQSKWFTVMPVMNCMPIWNLYDISIWPSKIFLTNMYDTSNSIIIYTRACLYNDGKT